MHESLGAFAHTVSPHKFHHFLFSYFSSWCTMRFNSQTRRIMITYEYILRRRALCTPEFYTELETDCKRRVRGIKSCRAHFLRWKRLGGETNHGYKINHHLPIRASHTNILSEPKTNLFNSTAALRLQPPFPPFPTKLYRPPFLVCPSSQSRSKLQGSFPCWLRPSAWFWPDEEGKAKVLLGGE